MHRDHRQPLRSASYQELQFYPLADRWIVYLLCAVSHHWHAVAEIFAEYSGLDSFLHKDADHAEEEQSKWYRSELEKDIDAISGETLTCPSTLMSLILLQA